MQLLLLGSGGGQGSRGVGLTGSIAQVLIGGEWRAASPAALHVVPEPATGKPLASSADCAESDFAAAEAAAAGAAAAWQSLDASARRALLLRAATRLRECAVEIATARARESGRAFFECLDELNDAAAALPAAAPPGGDSPAASPTPARSTEVIAAPTDGPLSAWLPRLGGALLAGLTVTSVASAESPLAVLAAARCFDMLPAGVLNVLTALDPLAREAAGGRGAGVSGTGAHASAHCLYVAAGADPELAVAAATWWRLRASGRTAGRCARIYVAETAAEAFADALHACMALLECGDPARPATDLGPLRSLQELRRLEDQLERALRQGMRLKLGGRRFQPWGLSGFFFQPTLLVSRSADESLDCEAFRGPVAIVSAVTDIAAALQAHQAHCPVSDLTLLAREPDATLQRLAAAGLMPRIHTVRAREARWFPYEGRLGELARTAAR